MNLTTDDLYLIIGAKEAELISLRHQNRQLQAALDEAKKDSQLQTVPSEADDAGPSIR